MHFQVFYKTNKGTVTVRTGKMIQQVNASKSENLNSIPGTFGPVPWEPGTVCHASMHGRQYLVPLRDKPTTSFRSLPLLPFSLRTQLSVSFSLSSPSPLLSPSTLPFSQ